MPDDPSSTARRRLFKAAGAAGAAAVVPTVIPLKLVRAQPPKHPAQSGPAAYEFLLPDEAAFVEAAIARLIPADELGPGALEAGVATYIDRQLAGAFGKGARLYRAGPWREGTPSQGYQHPFTPAELFRSEVRELDAKRFAALPAEARDEFLKRLEKERAAFFELLLDLTVEGFFADPVYGGNRDMAGWKLVGFPGAYANFYDLVDKPNARFTAPPLSIASGNGPGHGHKARGS